MHGTERGLGRLNTPAVFLAASPRRPSAGCASAWYGLVKRQLQIAKPALTTMRQTDVTWTWTGFGSPYIASQTTTIDPGQSYAKTMKSEQTLDLFGRLTVSKLYDFGALSTPKWETGVTYLSGPNYDSRWILNRVTGTTLKFNGGAAIQYSQASYDGGGADESYGALVVGLDLLGSDAVPGERDVERRAGIPADDRGV